ncbi:50S ribosomal protein L33 [Candidatus Coxiella mudrowiae]|uniref:Large ribosomal subunit protein bL33 n=1 Tax=Candidatus Coxiella mudrowiae TaxID=2054173 RepID=A0ABN4HQ79_9COXI|nr:50S ribosomal protein L33 [Candidatus Coxiella mudrowiae]AKQ33877.1 LSU ribosomal protein L33P [Candidatus Coxiella mudrowiae]
MAVSPREKIMLQSTGKTKAGKPTNIYYTTTKNKRNTERKLSIKKFDPRAWNPKTGKCGMHIAFKEKKIPK